MGKVVYNRKKVNPYVKHNFLGEDDFVQKFTEYAEMIEEGGYERVPSYLDFSRWLGIKSAALFNYLQDHPNIRERVKPIHSALLSTGAMLGKYRDASAIFTLKNMCDWTDKRESTNISADKSVATEEEAKEKVLKIADRIKAV